MGENLLIFIGGVNNNDYKGIREMAKDGSASRWSSPKTAKANMAFVGNIDDSIGRVFNSPYHNIHKPLHPVFDLAVLDRFQTSVPGWEIPNNKDENHARRYGLIVEYIAEAFQELARKVDKDAWLKANCKLGSGFDQRDQTVILKIGCSMLKILHPDGELSREELDEYLAYAVEGRHKVKEQLNKRKPDDESAEI